MKTGLDLVKARSLKDKIDLVSIEKKYEIIVPPVFRVFVESFKWEADSVNGTDFYYYPDLAGGEVTFPFESIEDNLESTFNSSDDEIVKRKLILFATNRFGFYVGTLKDEKDKILTKTSSLENSFKVVAENVFEFLRGITDNLSNAADTEEEYRQFMVALGYEEDELEEEIADWKHYKGL